MSLCLCGCGLEVKKNRKFIHGHNSRGCKLPKSEETKNKIRKIIQNMYDTDPSYRKRISITTKQAMQNPEIKKKLKNRIMTNELKEKISIKTKEALRKKEIRNKIGKKSKETWNKPGYKEKHKKCIAASRNDDWKNKISISRSGKCTGSGNPNWCGGASFKGYCTTWNDKEFYRFILERDECQCKNPYCWGITKSLVRHHIDYNKKNCNPNNIIVVCRSCNPRANKNRNYWRRLYKRIIKMKYWEMLVYDKF